MAGFDPKAYLADGGGDQAQPAPSFDPKAYLTKDAGTADSPEVHTPIALQMLDPGADRAFLEQAARKIPVLGHAVEKAGHALAAGLTSITPDSLLPASKQGKSFSDLYDQFAAQDKQDDAAQQKQYPKASMAAGLMGAGMLGNPMHATAAADAGLLAKAGTAALNAGTTGGLMAADTGLRTGDAGEAAKAGLIGVGAGLGLSALGGLNSALNPEGLSSAAGDQAVKALNPTLSQMERLEATKNPTAVGKRLLDEGIVTPLASRQTMANRLEGKLGTAGQDIGNQLSALDDATAKLPNAEDYRVNPADVADNAQRLVRDPMSKTAAYKGAVPGMDKEVDNLRTFQDPWSLSEANKQKTAYDKTLRWDQTQGPGKEALKGLRNELSDAIDSRVEQGSADTGAFDPDAFQAAKQRYGDLAQASQIANKSAAKDAHNNNVGLTSYLMSLPAVGAAMTGHPVAAAAGLAGVGAKEVAKRYGNQILASSYNAMANAMESQPEALGAFRDVLAQAGERGKDAVMATHMALMNDPKYRQLLGVDGGAK